jgi:hypothetical protein
MFHLMLYYVHAVFACIASSRQQSQKNMFTTVIGDHSIHAAAQHGLQLCVEHTSWAAAVCGAYHRDGRALNVAPAAEDDSGILAVLL